jgi:hypothetical protein
MPVIPPDRSEPFVPLDQIEREEAPGEPMEKVSGGEKTMLIIVLIALVLIVLIALVLPHTPFASSHAE